jgi:hypothetical protein
MSAPLIQGICSLVIKHALSQVFYPIKGMNGHIRKPIEHILKREKNAGLLEIKLTISYLTIKLIQVKIGFLRFKK